MTYTTERLCIRPYQQLDYDCWIDSFTASKPPRSRYDGGPQNRERLTSDWFAGLIAKHKTLAEKDDTYHLGVFDTACSTHIGHIDIHIIKREDYSWAWIGYYMHNQYQGLGYGPEAVSAAVSEFGFGSLGLKRIEAIINTDNIPSIKLAEKCGFRFECTKEKFIYEFGEWTDNHVYVILNDKKTGI